MAVKIYAWLVLVSAALVSWTMSAGNYTRADQHTEQPPANAPVTNPRSTAEQQESDPPATKRILKCRDSSGSITFTQGYCPPGTRQVEMPAAE